MKELKTWRLTASKTITYTTTVEAFDRIEAESMSRSAGLDWQMIQEDETEMEENTGYNVHTIEEDGGKLTPEIEDGYHPLPLLKKVCEKIIHYHYLGDWTVIDELLKNHTTANLEDLVSQEEN